MLLYGLLDRLLPRSYLAKVLVVVTTLGQGPMTALALLQSAGLVPPGLAWAAVAAAFGLGVAGAAIGLAAVLRPVARLEEAVSAFERGDASTPALPDRHGDVIGRLMARAARMYRTAESRIGEAERRAESDPLTGLLNRRGFERALAARREAGERGALLMLDLDHFKRVNDDHGHDAGDRVLREVAALLRSQMRRRDLSARFGGEEFVIYLAGIARDPSHRVAERLRMAVEDRISVEGRAQTVSIGVAHWPPGAPFAEILRNADAAVYAAKSDGRNRVHRAADAAGEYTPARTPSDRGTRARPAGTARSDPADDADGPDAARSCGPGPQTRLVTGLA